MESDNLVLIVSTGRRYELLDNTIYALAKHVNNVEYIFKKVWILDDKSTVMERYSMEQMFSSIFADRFNQINFNSKEKFAFIDKFNIIRKIVDRNDVVFFLEDDWELTTEFDILRHKKRLEDETEWDLILFADPLEIQSDYIKGKYKIDDIYWNNPFPDEYKHPIHWFNDGGYKWVIARMNNWGFNPSLVKADVYFRNTFSYHKNYEAIFADTTETKQVFTNRCYFKHIGYDDSLINLL